MTPKMFTFAKATSEMDSFALAKASWGAAAKDNAEVVAAATDLDNCSLFCAINCFVVWEEAYELFYVWLVFGCRSKKNVFHVSKQYNKEREVKKRETLRKKITLNSRISPPGKRYDWISPPFFVCFVGGTFLSFFSLSRTQGGLSHPNTRINIQFLSLSFSLWYTRNIYRRTTTTTTRPNPPLRARIHVARIPRESDVV
jgi:hypothetical protein